MSDYKSFEAILSHWRMLYNLQIYEIEYMKRAAIFHDEKLIHLTLSPFFDFTPPELSEFRNLKSLKINHLKILDNFQDILGSLPKLRSLSIRNSHLHALHTALILQNVTHIDCSFSDIMEFPVGKRPSQVQRLILAGNTIESIPAAGEYFPQLKTLDLSFTPIQEVGINLLTFPKLIDLRLWATRLTKVSDEIFGYIQQLDISSTPFAMKLENIDFKSTKILTSQKDRFRY